MIEGLGWTSRGRESAWKHVKFGLTQLVSLQSGKSSLASVRPMKLPKLHIRDLFWLVLVAACLCAWFVQTRRVTGLESDLRGTKHTLALAKSHLKYVQQYFEDKGYRFEFVSDGMALVSMQKRPDRDVEP